MAAPMVAPGRDQALAGDAVACVDDIRPGAEGSIHAYAGEKGRSICVIHTGAEHVYVYENDTRVAIYHLPSQCQCLCVRRDVSGNEVLVCGLRDGRIVHGSLDHLRERNRAKKKKKKKKKKEEKKEKHTSKDHQDASELASKKDENNIFGDLLKANETQLSSHPPPPAPPLPLDRCEVDAFEDVIALEPNIQDLLCVGGLLVTCARGSAGYTVSVYRPEESSTDPLPGLAKVPSLRMFLPTGGVVSPWFRPCDQPEAAQRAGCSTGTDEEGLPAGGSPKPRLSVAFSETAARAGARAGTVPSDGRLILRDDLYNQLFGVEANLRDLPVVLVCLPDGRVHYVPVGPRSPSGESGLPSRGARPASHAPPLLYVLDQPVAAVLGFDTSGAGDGGADDSGLRASDCVCLVGEQGRVVRLAVGRTPDGRETLDSAAGLVVGPVLAACRAVGPPPRFLYSTGRGIYAAALSASAERPGLSAAKLVLGIGKVTALAAVGCSSRDAAGGGPPLTALTGGGKVLSLRLPPAASRSRSGSDRPPASSLSAQAAGARMQALLLAVQELSGRSAELAERGRAEDRVLRATAQACHVASALLSGGGSGGGEIAAADFKVVFRSDGRACRPELVCSLTNAGPWTLSRGWSLLVTVDAAADAGAADARHHSAKSAALLDFGPGRTAEMILPLRGGPHPLGLPAALQCRLFFSPEECVRAFLPAAESDSDPPGGCGLGRSGLSLPLARPEVLDLLRVLRPASSSSSSSSSFCGQGQGAGPTEPPADGDPDWLAAALRSAALARAPANRSSRLKQTSPETGESSVSLVLNFSGDVVSALIRNPTHNEATVKPSSIPAGILKRLLKENTFVRDFASPLRLVTPEGKAVTLEVRGQSLAPPQERAGPPERRQSERKRAEIVLTAPDYWTLCQLQHSIDRKVKTILGSERTERGITTTKDWLRGEQKKAKILQRKLHLLQDAARQAGPSGGRGNADDITAALQLYQQMRCQLTLM